MKFIDEVTVSIASGKGGPGCVSFRRETKTPRGGPDGGSGGKGGDVIFVANPAKHSLLDLRWKKSYLAKNGLPGGASMQTGANGANCLIEVPIGTLVKDVSTGGVLMDLSEKGERVALLKGGRGGQGNVFYKSSVNQAPSVAQHGEEGQGLKISIELKLLADVGIIGLPNAGKSTLIASMSSARPKIADYPFTTLVPQLGVVNYENATSFVVADIPGLIPGAHKGVGLGFQFLKHIERTRIFLHLIDAGGEYEVSPIERYHQINHELKCYDETKSPEDSHHMSLMGREQIVVLTKMDLISDEEKNSLVKEFQVLGCPVVCISAVTRENLKKLIYMLGEKVIYGDRD